MRGCPSRPQQRHDGDRQQGRRRADQERDAGAEDAARFTQRFTDLTAAALARSRIEVQRHQLGIDATPLLRGILVGLLHARLDLRQARGDRHQFLDLQILALLVGQQAGVFFFQPGLGQRGVGHLLGQILGAGSARLYLPAFTSQADQRLHALRRDAHLDLATGALAAALVDFQHRTITELRTLAGLGDLLDARCDLRSFQLHLHIVLVSEERAVR